MADDTIYRQAAIDALMEWEESSVWDEDCIKHRGEPYWVAPSDVIEQLPSAQPNLQPTCNQLATDCISRQAAIKAIENLQDCYNGFSDTYDKACIIGVLEEIPTAQVDTPTDTPTVTYGLGKWIEKEDDDYHGGGYTECSVCGQRYSWGGYFEANGFRYCPRCGHRMEVEE